MVGGCGGQLGAADSTPAEIWRSQRVRIGIAYLESAEYTEGFFQCESFVLGLWMKFFSSPKLGGAVIGGLEMMCDFGVRCGARCRRC